MKNNNKKTWKDSIIYASTDYGHFKKTDEATELAGVRWGKFRKLKGNREVIYDSKYKKLLSATLSEGKMLGIGIVNEKGEVGDGQHRLAICMELGLPFRYVVINGFSLEDAQKLNSRQKAWTIPNYVDSAIELGKKSYLVYKDFSERFDLTNHVLIQYLSHGLDRKCSISQFKEGGFVVGNVTLANKICSNLVGIKSFFNAGRECVLASAAEELFINPEYSHKQMMNNSASYVMSRIRDMKGRKAKSGDGRLNIPLDSESMKELLNYMYWYGDSSDNQKWMFTK